MKKLFAILAVLGLLVGCTTKKAEETVTTDETKEPVVETTGTTLEIGIGSVTKLKGSDAGEKDGSGQANTTIAVLAIKDGKIAYLNLDVAQNTVKYDATGKFTDELAAKDSKKVLKEAYNMKGASGIGKEWYEQAAAFEEYAIGKTVEEIVSMELVESNGHMVPASEDLKTSVTIGVPEFLKAIEVANANLKTVENVAKIGAANFTTVKGSEAGEKDGSVTVNTNFGVVAVDAEGKIVDLDFDLAQNKLVFTAQGTTKIDPEAATPTKTEKGDDYGMKGSSEIGKEWYEQMAAFEEYVVGKTVDEVVAIPTMTKDDGHVVTTDEDLKTSVTMGIDAFQELAKLAGENLVEVK